MTVDFGDAPRVATQREDDFVQATAVAGETRFLVTGDRMVRNIENHQGVHILTPREFVDILGERS